MTPAEAIAASHAMRPPRNLSEALTEATLLGLELDTPDPAQSNNTTLRQRLTAYWQPAAPTSPAPPPPARRAPLTQWGAPVG
jgi:hypothetical protein